MSKKEAAPKETHSPLPWEALGESMRDAEGNIFILGAYRDALRNRADAALIVRAINRTPLFEDMLQALEKVYDGKWCHYHGRPATDCKNCSIAVVVKLAQDSKGGE